MELTEAQQHAERAYRNELAQMEARHDATKARDRLRKLSPKGGEQALPPESAADWEWHRQNQTGFDRLPFDSQRDEVLAITGPRGVDGYAPLRAAGFVLLDWFVASGRQVTATKFGAGGGEPGPNENLYNPSYAVDFLAQQFVALDPKLSATDPDRPGSYIAIDAAFRVARAYLAARSG